MNIFESSEDYLERILMLHEKNGIVRAIDIANDMNFSKASVSIALKKLKEKNLVSVDDNTGNITLTTDGMKIAESIYHRHKVLTKVFTLLGVKEETAHDDACKVEHAISEETFIKLLAYLEKQGIK